MTSYTERKLIAIHILFNISISKNIQAMKLGQLIKYNMRNIFLQKHSENKAARIVPDFFLLF